MTLLTAAGRVSTTNCRPSSTADRHLHVQSYNMESSSSGEVVDPADPPRRCLSVITTPSPARVSHDATAPGDDVDDLPPGNGGSSLASPAQVDQDTGTSAATRSETSSSASVVRDAGVKTGPVLSFSVAAIMAKSTSPPVLRGTHHQQAQAAAIELNHNNNNNVMPSPRRRRRDCPSGVVSPAVSPLQAVSPRRASAFTVDGILNGRTSTSLDDDTADDSSCSAADDSESNRSSPGVTRSFPPHSTTSAVSAASAPVTARQNLPFLHPAAGPPIDITCKWPPAACPYPWQYVNPPSE